MKIWTTLSIGILLLALQAADIEPAEANCTAADGTPTPDTCTDMLRGRRVIKRNDQFMVGLPTQPTPDWWQSQMGHWAISTMATPDNPGLGTVGTDYKGLAPTARCTRPTKGEPPVPVQARVAHLFDVREGAGVILSANASCDGLRFQVFDKLLLGGSFVQDVSPSRNPDWAQLAVHDFDGDDYDDLLVLNTEGLQVYSAKDPRDFHAGLEAFSTTHFPTPNAQTPINEPTTGDFNGDSLIDIAWVGGSFLSQTGTLSVFFATVCPGDVPDTICAGKDRFDVILDPARALFGSGFTSTIRLPDASLEPTNCGLAGATPDWNSSKQGSLRAGAVALGNFQGNTGYNASGAPIDGLIVAYVSGNTGSADDPCLTNVAHYLYRVPGTGSTSWARRTDIATGLFQEAERTVYDPDRGRYLHPEISLFARATRLDWYGRTEQVVLGFGVLFDSGVNHTIYPATVVVSPDASGNGMVQVCTSPEEIRSKTVANLLGLTTGVYTPNTVDVSYDGASACSDFDLGFPGDCSANPQFALLTASTPESNNSHPQIHVFNLAKSSDGKHCHNDADLRTSFMPAGKLSTDLVDTPQFPLNYNRAGNLLHAGDLTGTSLRVGAPKIMRVQAHTSTQVVVQAPPMHLDYVTKMAASGEPEILNLSVSPKTFYTTYEAETEQDQQASRQQTHSFSRSAGGGVEVEGKASVGLYIPIIDKAFPSFGIDASTDQSWGSTWENDTEKELGAYQNNSFATRKQTGLSDEVWYTTISFNVFNYPALGRQACPATITCDPSNPLDINCPGSPPEAEVELNCTPIGGSKTCLCTNRCPASVICNFDNPNDPNCHPVGGPPDVGIKMACSPDTTGEGCICRQESATVDEGACPGLPASLDAFACGLDGAGNACCSERVTSVASCPEAPVTEGDVSCEQDAEGKLCCTQQPLQAYYSMSGPREIDSGHLSGASLEWYQPLHEPGQILSYPSQLALVQNRQPDMDLLSNGKSGFFATQAGELDVETSWRSGTEANSSVGSHTDFEYDSSYSLTVGTVNIEEAKNGFAVTGHGSYGSSKATSTHNTYSYGQTSSTGISVSVEGADFLDSPVNYDYQVQAFLFASQQPRDILDRRPGATCPAENPKCDDEEKIAADISTYGPVVAAYTATPPPNNWWKNGPYARAFDVALNRPNRLVTVPADLVQDEFLQCRGADPEPECYTVRNFSPPGSEAADVWDNGFYGMRGFFVTLNTASGPARNQAIVGDSVFLRARVYNYSLVPIDYPYAVYARFYRQEVTVNEYSGSEAVMTFSGDAIPIGDKVAVENPNGTVPAGQMNKFNETSDPINDNISEAKRTFTFDESEAGKHWVFWMVVWAEDTLDGTVAEELEGHGLGEAFDPAQAYAEITDVPLELLPGDGLQGKSFTNNVGLFRQVFYVAEEEAVVGAPPPEALLLDQLTARNVLLGDETVVSAHVQAFGGHAPGVQVVFSELLPDGEWEIFDIEHLPMVESDDQHFVRATYRPETCGTREILVEAFLGSRMRAEDWTTIHVACKDGLELVCHRGRTIEASGAALAAHVRHGDSVGACP